MAVRIGRLRTIALVGRAGTGAKTQARLRRCALHFQGRGAATRAAAPTTASAAMDFEPEETKPSHFDSVPAFSIPLNWKQTEYFSPGHFPATPPGCPRRLTNFAPP